MKGLVTTLGLIWRLAVPYFRSEDRWAGRGLLAAVITIELAIVAINVLINQWNNRFYNALQQHNWDTFLSELLFFCGLAALYIVLAVYQLYLNQWLQIRWRRWLTAHYLGRWLNSGTHYRMQLSGDAADNPDQRIAEDVRQFIDSGTGAGLLPLGLGLLSSVVTLGSFLLILWALSAAAPLHLFGSEWTIPGYLVWAALIYSVLGTWISHLIGRPLIQLNFNQQRYEADFRFNLVRVRENSEQIALLQGNENEQRRLIERFGHVADNFFRIMSRQKRLTFFTAGYSQISNVFPIVVVSPAYFAGKMELGGLMQTASAFGTVQSAMSFFVSSYRQLAEWRAVVERLAGFEQALAKAEQLRSAPSMIAVRPHAEAGLLGAERLDVHLPEGVPLVTVDAWTVEPGDQVLVTGPSGAGKSTLFRAIAGIWPFGAGVVQVPPGKRVMLLPQRPYLPVGSLQAAVCYPADHEKFDQDRVRAVLTAVGLTGLTGRLSEEAHWNRMLSLGEQQRLAIARAILHAPDYLFLDEATASLDEPSEAILYALLAETLPGVTIVSIGHRSTLRAFHDRHWVLERDGDCHRLREQVMAPAEPVEQADP